MSQTPFFPSCTTRSQRGLTLVELLVALTLGLIVVLIATSSLLVARRGASTVDVASQLRDDSRFAIELVQRLVVQAGFEDTATAAAPYRGTVQEYSLANSELDIRTLPPAILGYNSANPRISSPLDATLVSANSDNTNRSSDTLILQYQPSTTGGKPDGSMIDCAGRTPETAPVNRADRILSVLYVANDTSGEPALMCLTRGKGGTFSSTPLVKGVESFQVLYGVDNVVANAAPTGEVDSVGDSYLRADQLTVAGDLAATYTNWRRVRNLRIGMVIRGPSGSAGVSEQKTINALGANFSTAADGSQYTTDNADSRLRQEVVYTVQLRNCQNQGYQPEGTTQPCDVQQPS